MSLHLTKSPFFRTKFSHKHSAAEILFFYTSSCISCTTWTRTGSACTRSRYENFMYRIVLFVSVSQKLGFVSSFFLSVGTHRITLISIENSSSRNSHPAALSFFPLMLDRKRVRMGNRRCRRTRRDSRRTISSRNRESRAKNGSGYFSRSNRRSSFKSSKIWIRDWISREEREKET